MDPLAATFALLTLSAACAIAGAWQLARGRAERAAIAERARLDPAEGRPRELRAALDRRLRATPLGDRLGQRLVSAGLELRPIDFTLGAALAALATLAVASLIVAVWAALALAALAAWLCLAWVDRKRAQRREEMIGQLPELARTLSNAVSAGLSTAAALELASRELTPPIADELQVVVTEARVGESLTEALERLRRRVPSRELGVLVSTIVIQQRAGGDSVRALQDMSHTLEARKDLIREVRTIMAGSVFSGWMVAGLGVFALILFDRLQPGLLREMTSTALGIAALAFAGCVYALGLSLIHRVTRVDL